MKRIVATASFALLAVPAFADDRGTPYEKNQFDRGIPVQTIPHDRAATGPSVATTPADSVRNDGSAGGGSAAPAPTTSRERAASGSTGATSPSEPVWAKDYNFIAPPL